MKVIQGEKDMIKIPYDELGKMSTQQTIQKLANSSFKTPQAFAVKHITKAIREGFFKMRDEYKKDISDKYCEKEEAPPEGTKAAELKLPFTSKAGMETDCKQALDDFGKRIFTLNKKKLSSTILFEVNEWTPRELESLEFLVEEPAE